MLFNLTYLLPVPVHDQAIDRFLVDGSRLRACLSAPWKGAGLQWGRKKTHPATFAPAGSSRGGHGSNEVFEALGEKGPQAGQRASRP
jgi:hypothetical protein